MVKHNIGTVNSMVRITCGLTLLSWFIAKMARQGSSGGQLFIAAMGAQKVAEGITRYCPLTEALGMEKSQTSSR